MIKIDLTRKNIINVTPHRVTRGNEYKIFKYRSRTECRRNSFNNRVINPWNHSSQLGRFRTHIKPRLY